MSTLGRRLSRIDGLVCAALAAVAVVVWKLRIIDPASQPLHVMANADFFTQIYPMSHRMAEWIRSGVFPLWNPYQYAGHPFLATGLYGVLYPPNVLHLLLPTHVAIEALMVFHLIVAGTTMFLFAREIGLVRTAAAFAGFGFMLSGFIVGQSAWFNPANAAAAWLPLELLAIERLVRTRHAPWFVVLAAAVALAFLPGWPQTWMYGMWASGGYAAVRVVTKLLRGDTRAAALHAAVLIGAGFALGGALMAAQLLPGLELQRLGPRRAGGLTLQQATALAPTRDMVAGQIVDSNPGHSRLAYVGTVTLVLLPLALLARRGRARALYFLLFGLAAVGVVLNVYTPVFQVYRLLPGAAWFRVPPRLLYLWATGAALAGAYAVDVLARSQGDTRARRIRTALVPTAAAAALVAFATLPTPGLVYLAFALAAIWVAMLAEQRVVARAALAALVAVAATDLGLAIRNPFHHPFHDPSVFRREAPLLDYVRDHQELDRTYIDTRFETPAMMSKQGTLWGIYSITDYEPLSLERYDQFFRLMELPKDRRPSVVTFTGKLHTSPASPTYDLLDLLSVRFAVLERPAENAPDGIKSRAPKWRKVPVAPLSPYVLYENASPLPRAYVSFAPRAAATPEEALATLFTATFVPRRDVVLEGIAATSVGDAPAIQPASIARYEPSQVVVETDAPRDGHLVLTDTWYPGWHADVDGAPVAILRANYLFRAVPVPAGKHTVTFTYAPGSFRVGSAISLFGLVVAAGVLLLLRRRPGAVRNAARRPL